MAQYSGHLTSRHLWVMIIIFLVAFPATATAQKRSRSVRGLKTVSGKILSVEEKGRTRVLIVEDEEGNKQEQILTSRTPVTIQAAGDTGFFREKATVSTEAVLTNNELFGKDFTVQLEGGTRPSVKQGKSKEVFELTGTILKASPESLMLNLGRGGRKKVNLEPGFQITVITRNSDLIVEGATIEMKGTPSRGRLKLRSVNVTLVDPLDSATYFESLKKSKSRRSQRRNASDKKEPEKESDESKNQQDVSY